jgi:hypothetical protein
MNMFLTTRDKAAIIKYEGSFIFERELYHGIQKI